MLNLGRYITTAALTAAQLLALAGLPVPPAARAAKDRSVPFACMDKPCGCMSAEQCRAACCCAPREGGWDETPLRLRAESACCEPEPSCCEPEPPPPTAADHVAWWAAAECAGVPAGDWLALAPGLPCPARPHVSAPAPTDTVDVPPARPAAVAHPVDPPPPRSP